HAAGQLVVVLLVEDVVDIELHVQLRCRLPPDHQVDDGVGALGDAEGYTAGGALVIDRVLAVDRAADAPAPHGAGQPVHGRQLEQMPRRVGVEELAHIAGVRILAIACDSHRVADTYLPV